MALTQLQQARLAATNAKRVQTKVASPNSAVHVAPGTAPVSFKANNGQVYKNNKLVADYGFGDQANQTAAGYVRSGGALSDGPIGRSEGPTTQPAPAVITSRYADNRNSANMNAYNMANDQLTQNNLNRAKVVSSRSSAKQPLVLQYNSATGTTVAQGDQQKSRTSADVANEELQKNMDAADAAYQDYKTQVASIMNGSYQISPSDQAQLQGIQDMIDRTLATQQKTNSALTSATQIAGIRSGRQRYAPEADAGIVGAAISAGTQRIADIEAQGASLLAEARNAIDKKNMDELNTAMTAFQQNNQAKSQAIQQMYQNTVTASNQAMEAAKFHADQAKSEQEAMQSVIQGSQEGSILGAIQSGITDPASIVARINYDAQGNLNSNPVSVKQVTELMSALKKAKEEPNKYQVIGSPGEGFSYIEFDESGKPIGSTQIIAPSPKQIDLQPIKDPNTGAVIGNYNSSTGESNYYSGSAPMSSTDAGMVSSAGRVKDSKYITDAGKLADDFNGNPVVKNFATQQEGFQFASTYDTSQNNVSSDQALLFAFMKVLDPTSVVREGEFATAQKNAGVLSSLGVKVQNILDGTLLDKEQRQKVISALKQKYSSDEKTYKSVVNQYSHRAEQYRIDPQDVVTDYGVSGDFGGTGGTSGGSGLPDFSSFTPNARVVNLLTNKVKTDTNGDPLAPEEIDFLARYATKLSKDGKSADQITKNINMILRGETPPDFSNVGGDTNTAASLGSLSEKFESGGNPGAIGYDSTGGYSYGAYQLAHNNAKSFVDQSKYANDFKGVAFNSKEFQNKWKDLAQKDPEGFKEAQKDYIKKTHYDPQIKKISDAGINVASLNPVVLDAIWSTAVQHGPNTSIIVKALKKAGEDASPEEQLKAIYDTRWSGGQNFASSTASVRNSVKNRFFGSNGELNQALKRLG